jgi:hypothetical protein
VERQTLPRYLVSYPILGAELPASGLERQVRGAALLQQGRRKELTRRPDSVLKTLT